MNDARVLEKAWFARVRWEILDMVRALETAPQQKEDLRSQINRLRDAGRIPETTAQLLHLILTARNKAEYEQRVYSGAEANQLRAAWESVRTWARPPARDGGQAGRAVATPAAPTTNHDGGGFPCPIPGCRKVFYASRGGWDAHVASYRMHKDWHPDVIDGEVRKRRFREEFAEWFV